MKTLISTMVVLLVLSGWAIANDPVLSTSEIVNEQQALRADIEAGKGRYADMPSVKRQDIFANQNRLFAILQGKSSTAELDPVQKVEATNALQSITAAINNRDDERIVCERQKMTGSNRTTRVCRSVAQIRADRENARTNMQVNQGICRQGVCVD